MLTMLGGEKYVTGSIFLPYMKKVDESQREDLKREIKLELDSIEVPAKVKDKDKSDDSRGEPKKNKKRLS